MLLRAKSAPGQDAAGVGSTEPAKEPRRWLCHRRGVQRSIRMRSNTGATEDAARRSFAAAGARCIRRAVHYLVLAIASGKRR
jgi:hypothetical protein